MSEFKSNSEFEKNVSASFGVPAVRPEFVNQVYANLMQQADEKSRKSHRFLGLRPAWAVASAILGTLIIGVFVDWTTARLCIFPEAVWIYPGSRNCEPKQPDPGVG